MQNAITIFGYLGAILVACLSIPQLFKTIKDRKTGEISFISFWIFHIGILLWVIWSSLSLNKFHNVIAANGITLVLESLMLFLMYEFKKEFKRKTKTMGQIAVVVVLFIGLGFILGHIYLYVSGNIQKIHWSQNAETTMGFIFPAFTTLAFIPQFIQSIKTKQWGGISLGMFAIYIINNSVWIIWWILQIVYFGAIPAFIGGLIWQLVSLSVFTAQMIFTIKYKK
ncbi:PQ-loop domain-containing transporter [Mycoplasmopsis edwardii]|uniref:PQ-loop domain-containing transporter n=1 Tax=Mycoplasmopsis edwardii TaxID=53558 RepID=A0ACD4PHF5_9BACT|nr:PQ-loop domain-containing transporter [Mycoplasmopsis edwardii]WBP84043.1 PQ-loop domain-containing transporter [Mycoplasmopsis edwardii]